MHIETGIRYYGKTSAIGTEAVYSSFLVVGVPIVPLGCWYGVRSDGFGENFSGRPIRWQLRSVLLAYVRWGLVVPAVVALCYASPHPKQPTWDMGLLMLSVALAALYPASLFLFVRAPSRERRQRELLAKIVRSTVDPAWLRARDCEMVMTRLRPTLESLDVPIDAAHWQLRNPAREIAPFVYAMARYMGPIEPQRDWPAIARRVWDTMDDADGKAVVVEELER